ncbi:MAG TPA: DUF1015 domain-containing protein [Candidatus Sulfotelmatobacter sp.]|nr:DUF1015 domain-containing protein [Candidatus Sulfotelmatobacter sp.]
MPEIRPFRALRYNPTAVPDLAAVVTPPYDVISPEAQARYYARYPSNVIRLILPREPDPEVPGRDRYERAARTFAAWQRDGILLRDPAPALYPYEQEFSLADGPRRRRRGLLALVRLAAYGEGQVFPHERTFRRHKDDRLQLMRACRADLEAILGFYGGPAEPVQALLAGSMAGPALLSVTDEEGMAHRLWRLPEPQADQLAVALQERPMTIADGHHRYETALTFRDEQRAAAGPSARDAGPHDFVLVDLVHADDPGLVILPTHRLVRRAPTLQSLRPRLAEHFHVDTRVTDATNPLPALRGVLDELARERAARVGFAAYAGGETILVVRLREAGGSSAQLDVAVLQSLVLEKLLEVSPEDLEYERDEAQALEAVATSRAALAWFLTPPAVKEVETLARLGVRMPQKSTYFYPKVLSGLLFYPKNSQDRCGAG